MSDRRTKQALEALASMYLTDDEESPHQHDPPQRRPRPTVEVEPAEATRLHLAREGAPDPANPAPNPLSQAATGPAQRSTFTEPQARVEAILLGHLPGYASPWVSQYADYLAHRRGEGVGLIRLDQGTVDLDLYRAEPPAGATEAAAGAAGAPELERALEAVSSHLGSWLVLLDEPAGDGWPAAPRSEHGRRRLNAIDRWTLLSGTDEAAVVGVYRLLKSLLGEGRVDPPAQGLGVMLIGCEEEAGAEAFDRIHRATEAFLSTPIELVGTRRRMEPVHRRHVGRFSDAEGDLWPIVERRLRSEVERIAPATPPAQSNGAAGSDSAEAGPPEGRGEDQPMATDRLSDEELRALSDAEPARGDREAAEQSLGAGALESAETESAPAQMGPLAGEPAGAFPGAVEGAIGSDRVLSGHHEETYEMPEFETQQSGAAEALGDVEQLGPSARSASSEAGSEAASRVGDGTCSPGPEGSPASLARFLSGVRPLEARSPQCQRVELGVDEGGRLHLMLWPEVGEPTESALRELEETRAWAMEHASLLKLTCRSGAFAESAAPVAHLFTAQPRSVLELAGAGLIRRDRLRLHLLKPVRLSTAAGGEQVHWVHEPLS